MSIERMRSRIFLVLLIVFLILPTAGCYDFEDIGSSNIILAMGVDAVDEHTVEVSIEYYSPGDQESSNSKSGGSSGSTEVRSAVGSSITDALSHFNASIPKVIDLAHNAVFVFGKSFIQKGIDQALDYLEKQRVLRRNELLVYTNGKAQDVLRAKTSPEKINAFGIRDIADQMGKQSAILDSVQFKAMRNYLCPSHTMLLIRVDPNSGGALEYSGVGVIQDGKLATELDSKDTPAIALLTGPAQFVTISVPCKNKPTGENGKVDIRLIHTSCRIEPVISGKRVECNVKIRGLADVERICPGATVSSKVIANFEQGLDKEIKNQINTLVEKLQEHHIDAIQLGTRIFRKNPAYWKSVSNRWPNYLSQVRFHYNVDVNIYRTGLSDDSPEAVFSKDGTTTTKLKGRSS